MSCRPTPTFSHQVLRRDALVQPDLGLCFGAFSIRVGRAIRTLHPDVPMYTFWGYKRNRSQHEAGLRLDHLLLNAKAAKRLVDAGVDREVRGLEGATTTPPLGSCCAIASHGSKDGSTFREANPPEKRKESSAGAVAPPPAAGHRRGLIRASLLSCSCRNNPKAWPQTCRRHPGLCRHAASASYRGERPRAVLVGWDTLEAPTCGHQKFLAYQSGREFDDALIEQLDVLPEFVAACGFRMRKRRVSRRMIFSPPLPPKKKGEGALSSLRAATATRFSLPPTAPPSSTPSALARWRVSAPPRFVRRMRRPRAGSGFYRLARRSLRQSAGRTGRWRDWCCDAAAKIRQPRSRV